MDHSRHRRSISNKGTPPPPGWIGDTSADGKLYPHLLRPEQEPGKSMEEQEMEDEELHEQPEEEDEEGGSGKENDEEDEEDEKPMEMEEEKMPRKRGRPPKNGRLSLPAKSPQKMRTKMEEKDRRRTAGPSSPSMGWNVPDEEEDEQMEDEQEDEHMRRGMRHDGGERRNSFWRMFDENAARFSRLCNTPFEYPCLVLVGVGLVLAIILSLFLIPLVFSMHKMTPEEQLGAFRRDLQRMLGHESVSRGYSDPHTRHGPERTLYYFADAMVRRSRRAQTGNDGSDQQRENQQRSPLVLLMAAGRENTPGLQHVAAGYPLLFTKHWPEYRIVNVSLQPSHTKSDLERMVLDPLMIQENWDNKIEDIVLILNGIDRLAGDAPLFLHSLADPEHSPLADSRHNVLLILTMTKDGVGSIHATDMPGNEGTTNCEQQITNSLLSSWQSDLVTDDQIYPIVARINAIPICLI